MAIIETTDYNDIASLAAQDSAAQPPDPTPGGTKDIPVHGRKYHVVTFTPHDPENPKNWSKAYKWYCTMVVAATCFVVAFASSVVTADIEGVAEEFEISQELALLSITLFVVGFGIGESELPLI
jgi:hypothetical protein